MIIKLPSNLAVIRRFSSSLSYNPRPIRSAAPDCTINRPLYRYQAHICPFMNEEIAA
jgi:hypothetical protein